MPLHPALQSLLQTPFADMLFDLKQNYAQVRAASAAMQPAAEDLPPVAAVENRVLNTAQGDVPVRIYTPEGEGPWPLLVYFHGGGFVLGSLDSHDLTCRNVVRASGYKVISVDYRLAPEHAFPAAPEDCFAATEWAARNAAELNIDAQHIAVGGDSAGGNLAAAVALMARDRGGPALAKQVLVYPVIDHFSHAVPSPYASYSTNAKGYMLTSQAMEDFWDLYLASADDRANPYASPIRAEDLRGLPPALVITAEYDPLCDEGTAYAQRLQAAGVPVTLRHFDGMIHGFWGLMDVVAKGGTEAVAEFLADK
jgi:acetyl esterase